MANFIKAQAKTADQEGGWTVDTGGETYKGISWKAWKNDPIVKKIFAILRPMRPRRGQLFVNVELDQLITAFYKKNYWDKIYGDQIYSQGLAELVYDFFVNAGPNALAMINRAIGTRVTGTVNEGTLHAFNNTPAYCYLQIIAARKAAYVSLAKKNPKKYKKYLSTWLARLDTFPKTLSA
jgi:lysozyme family protein